MKSLCCCWLLLLLAVSYQPVFVVSQTDSSAVEPCQSLLGVANDNPQCSSLGNCTGLRCDQRDGVLDGSSATFVVTKCVDPVAVDLSVESSGGAVDQRTFTEDGTALYAGGSANVSVGMWRNASHLLFQAALTGSRTVVIPQVYVPLNASDCMCEALTDLADLATHPLLDDDDCMTNEACDGVRCELEVFGSVFYLEFVIEPCLGAVNMLVEDSSGNVLHSSEFNQTETKPIQVGFFTLQSEVIIMNREYSMEVQVYVQEPFFGRVEIVPQYTIILDKTNCTSSPNLPPTAPPLPTTPPPPILPPSTTDTCRAFFGIVTNTRTDSFMCVPMQSCEKGISCRLDILDTHYHINISLTLTDDVMFRVEDGPTDRLLSDTAGQNVSVSLPKPVGGSLKFVNIAGGVQPTSVSFLLTLLVPDLASSDTTVTRPTTLIPLTTIPLEETCQVLSQYAAQYPLCTGFSGCSGAQCRLTDTDSVVSFTVTDKCVDPVAVGVSVRSSTTGELSVQRQFTHADRVFIGGNSLYVEVGRNATDLQFEATLSRVGSPNVTAVPRATVPLNASECMCSSLRDLADKAGGTSIEPECRTNQQCNGVNCEVDILASVFYLESIILPCAYAVEVVLRNSQRQPLFMTVYNRTEVHVLNFGLISTNLYVEIVRRPYSMEVSGVLDAFQLGNVTIVPRHTIILDKTSCDLPHIITIAPPTAPPTPTSPPPSAPEICHVFDKIVRASREPFLCKPMKDCKTGIQCTLEVLDVFYTVSITIVAEDKAIIFTVSDSIGRTLGSATSKNVTISLPKPERSSLVFNQSVSVEKASVGFSLALLAPGFGSESSRLMVHSLIDYTEVPVTNLKPATQRQTALAVGIAVPILILLVVAVVALLSALGCMVYCRQRNAALPPIQFKHMRNADDLETLDALPENCEYDPDHNEKKLNLGDGSHKEAPHYEQPPFDKQNSGSMV